MSVNKVILIGNVGKDPEFRSFDGGSSVASTSLATSETYTKNGEKVTNTEWHNIVFWGKTAEVVNKYVKKGAQIYVEGKLKTEAYEKDGQTRYVTKVVCERMQMLGSKGNDAPHQQNTANIKPSTSTAANTVDESGDLPF